MLRFLQQLSNGLSSRCHPVTCSNRFSHIVSVCSLGCRSAVEPMECSKKPLFELSLRSQCDVSDTPGGQQEKNRII
jgi:hypothetical protein